MRELEHRDMNEISKGCATSAKLIDCCCAPIFLGDSGSNRRSAQVESGGKFSLRAISDRVADGRHLAAKLAIQFRPSDACRGGAHFCPLRDGNRNQSGIRA